MVAGKSLRRLLLALSVLCALGAPAAQAASSATRAPATQAASSATRAPAGSLKVSRSAPSEVSLGLLPCLSLGVKPPGWKASAGDAMAVAKTSKTMLAIHKREHPLTVRVYLLLGHHYEVYFWYRDRLVGDVLVSPAGHLMVTYTGPLMIGYYARGHYGSDFDLPIVWLPLGLAFLLPLVLLRNRATGPWLERDRRTRGVWLDRLDIAMLLSFGVSYALFDTVHFEPGVWMAYPPLLYLLGRMLWRGMRGRRRPARRLETRLPVGVLALGLIILVGVRVFLTLSAPQVMDVGGASAIGAYRILHGLPLYFTSTSHPDTYGPIAYLLYAPFQLIWPNASWASFLPSVRAATITFDVLTIAGLVLLGVRLRKGRPGLKLGLLLAWLWAACPFTALGLVKNTNDGLVAMFMVALLLVMTAPFARGALLGLATAAKFFPGLLLGLVAAGPARDKSAARKALAGFVIAAGTSVALFLPPGGIKEMWDHTMGFQLTRTDIFSPWALHPGLAPIKVAIEIAVVALAVLVAFRPRGPRSLGQVSALAAALTIAVQLPAVHWFYLYIVWFVPLVLVAVLAGDEQPQAPTPAAVVMPARADDPIDAPDGGGSLVAVA